MAISDEHVDHFLEKAREITELYKQYVLGSDSVKKSADDLHDVCREYCEIPINILLVNLAQGPTLSCCVLYPNHCDIYVRAGLSPSWNRFVKCKELFHLVIDREDCRSLDIYEHLEAINTPAIAEESETPEETPNAAVWESLAEAAAMEFLFPYAEREEILGLDSVPSFEEIAKRYGIPLVYAESYLSEKAMKFFKAFRADGD